MGGRPLTYLWNTRLPTGGCQSTPCDWNPASGQSQLVLVRTRPRRRPEVEGGAHRSWRTTWARHKYVSTSELSYLILEYFPVEHTFASSLCFRFSARCPDVDDAGDRVSENLVPEKKTKHCVKNHIARRYVAHKRVFQFAFTLLKAYKIFSFANTFWTAFLPIKCLRNRKQTNRTLNFQILRKFSPLSTFCQNFHNILSHWPKKVG
jgi:hypothetical protein